MVRDSSAVLALLLLVPAVQMDTSTAIRAPDEQTVTATEAPTDSGAMFRGGHAENQKVDLAACEFKKTHEQSNRYATEVEFLKRAVHDPVWAKLVPQFLREEDHDGQPFIVMHNFLCGFTKPIIADFKLGTQSWKPDFHSRKNNVNNIVPGADADKRRKMDKLDEASTTKVLGVRVTSVQMPPAVATWVDESVPPDAEYQAGGRVAVKQGLVGGGDEWKAGANVEDFSKLLLAYLPTPALRAEFVKKLSPFLETFSVQKTYRFTGASLFVFYDGKGAGSSHPRLNMALLDFPHTLGSPDDEFGELDIGVLRGLTTLRNEALAQGIE